MNNPNPVIMPGITPENFNKLKKYLIEKVAREMELSSPPIHLRRQIIIETLEQSYQQLNVSLSKTIREQLFREILDDFLGFGPKIGRAHV